ncbi:hypothetical protein QBC46DRAFT_391903 [Diplogelasinospora grovesii]|uniref:Uncharacterized protein n=1 Tax=Diplogelasinospora grovesii TaxID=303347 RepID=A0AAN6N3K8_9PEZI|nr:hypothetical protein QBC46DRAFT_391903 [Diplogelasinospora grovesii]
MALDLQDQALIRAAAAAGIPWIIPTEFGSDVQNEKFLAEVPLYASQRCISGPRQGTGSQQLHRSGE